MNYKKNDTPVIILCGGKGTRLSEMTTKIPKPMVEVGGKPILWHIMKIYSGFGYYKFIIALGYKGEKIKQYFFNYKVTGSDIVINLNSERNITYLNESEEKNWDITLVDTGENSLKGSRIKKLEKYVNNDVFHLTYGDGVSDVDLNALAKYHNSHECIGTVTAVRPPSRFGELKISHDNTVHALEEKPQMGNGLINGGFFVFSNKIFTYLNEDINCDFEFGPLQKLASEGQLKAFHHKGFWQCMDNVRERDYLDKQVRSGKAKWIKN